MGKHSQEKRIRKKDPGSFPSREESAQLAESLRAGFGLMKKDQDDKTLPKRR